MDGSSDDHPPVVTLAALYGAGGGAIGPRVADRLGVPYLARVVGGNDAAPRWGRGDEGAGPLDDEPRTPLERVTAGLGRLSTLTGGVGGSMERLDAREGEVRSRVEELLAEASRSGGVVLGRGGMVVLRSVPWALHVHLGGPPELRIARRMEHDGIDRATAEADQQAEDRARISYVRRVYGADGEDPGWYHLMLDSTALDDDTCVELIVAAAAARVRDPRPSPTI